MAETNQKTAVEGPVTAAIHYLPEGFDTGREKLMGRHAAGESFLAAMARHASAEALVAYTPTRRTFEQFRRQVTAASADRACRWVPVADWPRLAAVGTLFEPGPGLSDLAWMRRYGDQRAFSLCGVTHTTASDGVMGELGRLVTDPLQDWDALICTTEAVKGHVVRSIEAYGAYLGERLGARRTTIPQLPVIPLGVDCDRLAPTEAAVRGGRALRAEQGIGDDDVAVLFLGRLSLHAKAHPFALYLALERVARRTSRRLHLILAGWTANASIEQLFADGARDICPSVNMIRLDGRQPAVRDHVWHAADVFVSPVDNIQETFGLTPVEAMAAGLPAVVSDYDGYKGTVADGETGYRVPTWAPPPGAGRELALRYLTGVDSYDHYIANASQATCVEVGVLTDVLARLVEDADLRRRMGAAGQARARALFDWPVVLRQYEDLWTELAARRRDAAESAPRSARGPAHPLRDDPFALFAHYPSAVVTADTVVMLAPDVTVDVLRARTGQPINRTFTAPVAPPAVLEALFESLTAGETTLGGLVDAVADEKTAAPSRAVLLRSLLWLAKLDIVRLKNP